MQRWQAFKQLILARIREFFREPEVIFWVYGFPILLAVGLGIAFAGGQPKLPIVDVQAGPGAEAVARGLKDQGLNVAVRSAEDCHARLIHGKTDLYVIPDPVESQFVYDQNRSEGVLARRWVESLLLREKLGKQAPAFRDTFEQEPGSRYIDFLLPGLIGMNIMGGGLFGVGFVLVDMRVRKLFKRLMATPMRRGDFLMAILTARLLFLLPEMLALLLLGRLAFAVPIHGSLITLVLVMFLGAMAFAGIGLLVACRTDKTETISGLINLVMLPMYLMSGIFFSADRFPEKAQPFIQALPLTQLNDALRAVMLEGASLMDIAWRLGLLGLWAIVCFTLALRWFRWG